MSKPTLLRAALVALTLSVALASAANAGPLRNRLMVAQGGNNNGAAVVQNGQGNTAGLGQAGNNNTGAVVQVGNNNAGCLYQMGSNLNGSIEQYGDNGSVALVQTPAGTHAVSQEVCMAQLATGGRRYSDIYRNTRVSVRPGR